MEVFRICKQEHAGRIIASGSANRWNLRGQNVVYTASSRSLATLELMVHRSAIIPATTYKVMVISITDIDSLMSEIRISDLPENWRTVSAYATLQQIGYDWYSQQKTLLLKVPSAVISYEYNYVINTEHPDFIENVQLKRIEDFFWDKRLL